MLNYDKQNRLIGFGETAGTSTYRTAYAYDNDNRVTEIDYDGSTHKIKYAYDNLGRIATRTAECGADAGKVASSYTYVAGGHGANSTTPLVAKITQPQISFEYVYDSRGNIISEKRNGVETTYAYDALGQLIRVNDPHENATWVYTYDRGGNITSKVKYAYTTSTLGTTQQTISYTYGDANWKDKLTAYNGKVITYDAIGNPLNDGTWTYTWAKGRQLQSMTKSGMNVSFSYDHNGLRTQKIVEQNGVYSLTTYALHGKQITHMVHDADELHFFYDTQSHPVFVDYNGTKYTYVLNLQCDIVALLDNNGATMVEYKYDAWGKPLSTTGTMAATLGKLNPFRYRGYVYDEETELYYLQSRYYNPVWGRFVNMDVLLDNRWFFGTNLYAYCRANPVLFSDPTGKMTGNYSQRMMLAYFDSIGKISLGTSGVPIGVAIKYKAEETVNWVVDTAKQFVVDLMQAGIRTAQIDYYAYRKAEKWISDNRKVDINWGNVWKYTLKSGITTGIGSATTGALAAACGAPFTAGFSVLASGGIGFCIGFVGGVVEGFVQFLLDEIWP